uniref:Uncharacterized protein n=1 Tax=Leviviridae sp. TaxID=2027243 RepID=A0A514D6N0_9VIRU|nr:MAG: hypothetical protein H2Rhizo32917_000003 [Leviviridae sp.]
MTWSNKDQWRRANGPYSSGRRQGKSQSGEQGNRVDPTRYGATYGRFPLTTPSFGAGEAPDVDVPNLQFVYRFFSSGVPFPGARNRAWSKLVDRVRSGPASLGESIAESHKALKMIAGRATQMYHAYSALRRGNFRGFLRELSIGPYRKHKNWIRSPINQASSLWLEYSFGWKPLIKDIYDGCTVLSKPVPGNQFHGSGREDYSYDGPDEHFFTQGVCAMGAFVTVDSPNAYLLQSMGVANPIQIAWNLIPMSFLADWVFDINTFLGALTDFVGCSVQRPWTLYFARTDVRAKFSTSSLTGQVAVYTRRPGLDFPYPNVSILTNIGHSITRAANAVSLLGQLLTK